MTSTAAPLSRVVSDPLDPAAEFEKALKEPPSSIVFALLARDDVPGISDVRARLEAAGLEVLSFESVGAASPEVRWEARAKVRFASDRMMTLDVLEPRDEDEYAIRLETDTHRFGGVIRQAAGRELLPSDTEASDGARFVVAVETIFGVDVLGSYADQMRVLAAVAPDASVIVDGSAFAARPRAWVEEVITSRVPPAPDALFSIHAVADDGTTAWMHTHGLARCGTLELEALDVPVDFTGLAGQLINTIAAMILEHGIPEPGEVFEPGRDIDVAWMPWFDGIKKVKRSAYGRRDGDRDEAHRGARGVLLVPRKGWFGTRWLGLDTHRPVLEDNPVLFVSSLETLRHKLLAKERQGRFRALFERFSAAERWVFLIKLGYTVDGAEDKSSREHLWFRVHGIDDARVDATLVNEPHQIARMHEGDRGHHDLALMSSWVVLCEHGKFDPESIGILERKLSHEGMPS